MRLFGRPFARPACQIASHAAHARRACGVEGLESRILFHLELISAIPNTAVAPGTTTSEINLAPHFDNEEINGTIVRMQTPLGDIDIQLFDTATPATVANFLNYVNNDRYNGTFFHRAISGFVVQGGGYLPNRSHIPTDPPVVNEFSPSRSNLRGTLAMAKSGGDPNSATSEFFFNLEDNSANLDNQNGGFTTFARVIGGDMAVVDAIAGGPITDEDTSTPFNLYNDLPTLTEVPDNTVPATSPASNLVLLNDASVIPEAGVFSYTVASTNPALVTGGVDNGVLRLNYTPGQTGSADITVTATDGTTTVTDTFTAGIGVLDVAFGNGGAKAVTFTDADGTVATVSLKGGAGTLRFSGTQLTQTDGKSGATVAGAISDVAIDLTSTGNSGALTVKAGGGSDGLVNVNQLTASEGMKSIAAKQVNIVGNVTIAGNVGKADFADVTNSIMSFGGSGGGLSLSLRNANAVDIISASPIKSLKAESFSGGGPDVGSITTPILSSLTVNGDFGQRLDIPGTLGTVKINGVASTFLPWNVGGSAGKLTIGSTAEGFVADFLGGVSSLTVNGNLSGDIVASAIKTLTVKGDMSSANLTLTGPGAALGKATVSGAITSSRIQATSGIGAVTAGSISNSTIYAGLSTDGGILPTSQTDLNVGLSEIKSVTVKGRGPAPTYVGSNIAARSVGKLSLGVIQAGNGSVPFGVAGDTIAAITGTGTNAIKLSKLSDPTQSTVDQDFRVNVL